MMSDLILCVVVWLLVFYAIRRGYRKTGRVIQPALLTWLIFILLGIVMTIRAQPISQMIDSQFDEMGVASWLCGLLLILIIILYTRITQRLVHEKPDIFRYWVRFSWLPYLPIASLAFYLGVLALALTGKLSKLEFFYGARFVFETQVLFSTALMFLPINLQVVKQEKIYPMRVRHCSIVVMCLVCGLYAILNIVSIPFILATGHINSLPHLVPRATLVMLCLMIEVAPTRLISFTVIPPKLCRLYLIKRVERKLNRYIPFKREPFYRHVFSGILELDMSTYRAVINILENYRKLEANGYGNMKLYSQLAAISQEDTTYKDLVRGLCRVSI